MKTFLNTINNKDIDLIDYLNLNIWVRLDKVKYGVGVIAIRDIPKNTKITDYDDRTLENLSIRIFLINYKSFAENFYKLHPNIQNLVKDRYMISDSGEGHVISPNCHQLIRMYINHSDNPNLNKSLVATKDIPEGEEITFSYKELIADNINQISKEHFHYAFK